MANTLNQLRMMTTVVADTGDLNTIERLRPVDATTNPSLITKALTHSNLQPILIDTLAKHNNNIDNTIDELTVYIGREILQHIDGRVSTEVDARLSFDTEQTVAKALAFLQMYEQMGVDKQRVLIKIAGTWQGIQAAKILEEQGIHCNITLIFGLHQAIACADANVTLISPFVGRILDYQKQQQNRDNIPTNEDLGILSVKTIYSYFKQHGYQTQVMGASFRNVDQILALAGCDLLTISPDLIDNLRAMDKQIERQLFPDMAFATIEKQQFDEQSFTKALEQDSMATKLLTTGIDGFINAREELANKLQNLVNTNSG
ncbi:transaldolase B [Moraxella macacae 0408225]|uniref:transaldolase n=1 Tax=Moraxella macacae 0408225 TaxID=1230338 RepID=L2F6Y9_9GAMM|nr:transaldolase [Moraxella macacae]ELA08655.1 transaldolase B [Moraxella macacae 0408225]